jgi:hypothetical protein
LYSNRLEKSKFLNMAVSNFFGILKDHFNDVMKFFPEDKKKKDDKTIYRKMMVYSGHDTNLVNIIATLINKIELKERINKALDDPIVYKSLVPEFASHLFFELHKVKKSFEIHVKFNGFFMLRYKAEDFIKFVEDSVIDTEYTQLDCMNSGHH